MLQTFSRSSRIDIHLSEMIMELFEDTMRAIIYTVALFYFIAHMILVIFYPGILDWRTLFITTSIGVTVALSLRLLNRHLHLSVYTWLLGLAATNILIIFLFHRPEFAILFSLFPLMAVIIIGWPAGIVSEVGIGVLTWLLSSNQLFTGLPQTFYISIVMSGLLMGIIGWVSTNSLVTVTNWSSMGFEQARKSLEEARQHRAQLSKALKDLDMAYYRLERASAALTAAWKEAEEAKRSKAEFVVYVSHEMRTPLNLILGFSDMVLTSPVSYGGLEIPGPYREDINKIYQNAQHLLAIVEDVIDLSRAEVGKISLMREDVDIQTLVIETGNMVRDYITTKGLSLQINVSPNLPHVLIDRLRIRQVLLNLLVNAARFTKEGGIKVDVTKREKDIFLQVMDSGQGISTQDLPHIFDEYHTSEPPSSSWHGNFGLGLPISKKLIELHSGHMGVESVANQGTTFWFSLPVGIVQEQVHPLRAMNKRPYWLAPADRVCVLVNNDPSVFPIMQRLFQNIRLLQAKNINEGIEISEESKAIGLVIDNNQVIPPHAKDLLIFQCPLPMNLQIRNSLGTEAVLQKPITMTDLFGAIEQLNQEINKIMIVDDDPEVVQLYQRMLYAKYPPEACIGVYTGADLFARVNIDRPDVILLDLNMPGMDGFEIINTLKADPSTATIPIIVITGMAQNVLPKQEPGEIRFSRQDGFNIGEIVRTIEAVLTTLTPGWSPDLNQIQS
jgi:signal transduction histidine kinase